MATSLEEEDDDILKVDYYSLLNVSREASKSEIDGAYKRLCRIYHPDKHPDPGKKKKAEELFSKLKRAHEVLSDEHKKVIYDLYGEKGMETYKMEVVSRTKTPAEIIAEYKRIQEDNEERHLQNMTRPETRLVLELDGTDIFEPYNPYNEEDEEEDTSVRTIRVPSVRISKMSLYSSVKCPLTSRDICTIGGKVTSSDNGLGANLFKLSWKRLLENQDFRVCTYFGSLNGLNLHYSRRLFKLIRFNTTLDINTRKTNLNAGFDCQFDEHWRGGLYWHRGGGIKTELQYNADSYTTLFQINLGLGNNYIFTQLRKDFEEHQVTTIVNLTVGKVMNVPMGFLLNYGVTKKITNFSYIGASVSIGYPTGVTLEINCNRGNHTFRMPITMSDEIVNSAVLYGTFVPIVTYFAVKKLIVDPFILGEREKKLERKRQEQREQISQRKREAQTLMDLMKETIERNIEVEQSRNGLIIITALYGKLSSAEQENLQTEDCIDVTLQLQALVANSQLTTPDQTSKQDIPGFYDPCIGEDKSLYIKYRFRNRIHHTTVKDLEKIRIPQQSHLYKEDHVPKFPEPDHGDT